MKFNINLASVRKRIGDKVLLVQKKIAFDILSGIVNMTPVDTGRARGNWFVTLAAPHVGMDWEKKDVAGGGVISDGSQTIQSLQNYGAIYLTNNLPYIVALEKGHSKQATPGAMVQLSIDRVAAGLR